MILKKPTTIDDFRHFQQLYAVAKSSVTIGNFDGCHRGHQALIKSTLNASEDRECLPLALTFSPRPAAFFRTEANLPTLFTDDQKVRALWEQGIECVVLQKFNQEFSHLTHEDFYLQVLLGQFHVTHVTIGRDFCFGRGRMGHASWLQARGSHDGIEIQVGEDIFEGAERISSTKIRDILSNTGEVDFASKLLGRPYLLEGNITRGDQIGRTWGFPTANLSQINQLTPFSGVYAGWVWLPPQSPSGNPRPPVMSLPQDKIPAVFSIGSRPTLGLEHPPLRVEAHLLSGNYGENSLYGLPAGYYLTHRIRGDLRFDNIGALRAQIANDAATARHILLS